MGYWDLRNNERSKEMKESIIWCEKYSELEIHRKCVRSSTWVSEVLRIWGAKWDLKMRERRALSVYTREEFHTSNGILN